MVSNINELVAQVQQQRDDTAAEIDRLTAELSLYDQALAALQPITRAEPVTVSPIEEEHGGGGHVCPDCRRTFPTGHGLAVHRARTHPATAKPERRPADRHVACGKCGTPITARNLKRHEAVCGQEGEHRCDDCGRTFDTANGLGGHRGRAHPKLAAPVTPIGKTGFDPDRARVSAAEGAYDDNAGIGAASSSTPAPVAEAKTAKPAKLCTNGCGALLSLYNETGICAACETAIRRNPLAARNAG